MFIRRNPDYCPECPHCARKAKIESSRRAREEMRYEEARLEANSTAYHDDPSNPSSCIAYEEHFERRCPCENYVLPPRAPRTPRDYRHHPTFHGYAGDCERAAERFI